VFGRPAEWRVSADRARLGRPGSRLPLRASVAGLGAGHIVAAARLQLVDAETQLDLNLAARHCVSVS